MCHRLCGCIQLVHLHADYPTLLETLIGHDDEMVGDPVKDKEMMEKYSPVFHVDQIKAPLFIAQGANDPRVNKAESDQMVEALEKTRYRSRIHGKRQRRTRFP